MAGNTYIVLRRRAVQDVRGLPLMPDLEALGQDDRRSQGIETQLQFGIETIEGLQDRDAAELKRDPTVAASSLSIPLSLVTPVSAEIAENEAAIQEAQACGASWGILEIAPAGSPDAGAGITVAVLDTGIDPTHPAFHGIALTRKNFSASAHEDDVHGHGTHCAGTIFGRDIGGVRIGVARGVRAALIGKILDDGGHGNSASIVEGIRWAYELGAQVMSISVGVDFTRVVAWLEEQGKARAEAISRALAAYRDTVRVFDSVMQLLGAQSRLFLRSSIAVAAAGNDSDRRAAKPYVVDASIPAAATDVVSVGAIGRGVKGYEIAPFSNINPLLCAPGVGIVSARRGGGLTAMSGTSMATPHIAGLAVLWWERTLQDNPRASSALIRAKLLGSCRQTGFAPGITPVERGEGLAQAPG